MSDWQSEGIPQVPDTSRMKWAVNLTAAIEQAEDKLLADSISQDDFYAELREIDAKLAIIGLTLAAKPWLKPPTGGRL